MAIPLIRTKRYKEEIMHPLTRRCFEKVLGKGELLGVDRSCKYYPCHSDGLEDCTFCSCPFHPCGDESMGGKWIKGIWWCKDCNWIHRTEVAGRVLKEIKDLGINKPEDIEERQLSLKEIRERVKAIYPPQRVRSSPQGLREQVRTLSQNVENILGRIEKLKARR